MRTKSPLAKIPEEVVIQQIKILIATSGLRLQRINTGCFKVGNRFIRTAQKGTLDFEGYDRTGRFIAIECKRPVGGRLSPEQKARIDDINACGGVAIVATSDADAIRQLRERGVL